MVAMVVVVELVGGRQGDAGELYGWIYAHRISIFVLLNLALFSFVLPRLLPLRHQTFNPSIPSTLPLSYLCHCSFFPSVCSMLPRSFYISDSTPPIQPPPSPTPSLSLPFFALSYFLCWFAPSCRRNSQLPTPASTTPAIHEQRETERALSSSQISPPPAPPQKRHPASETKLSF